MKTKNNIFSVMLSGAKYLWHGAAPAHGRRSFTMFRMTMMLAAAMALAACTNDESLAPAPADALAAMNPETRIGISAELGGELTASRNTTTEAVYAMSELHGTKSDVNFTLNLPGGVKTQLYPTGENGYNIPIAFNALAEKLPLYLKDFNLTEGNGRCVSRWTILGANSSCWDNSLGWARLAADETGKPKLSYTLQRSDAKVTLKVVDAEGNAINMNGITAAFKMTGTLVTPIYTGAGDATNGYPALNFYLSDITTLAADDAVDANKIKLAVYAFDDSASDSFSSLVDAAGIGLADGHAYSSKNGYVSAIVLATPTHTNNADGTYTPITTPAFADADVITIIVPDDYSGLDDNQVGGTYKLKFADIAAGNEVPDGQKTTEGKLKYLAPGDHLTVTVTLSHNSVASATATLGSWTAVGAEGGAAAGGDAEAFRGVGSLTDAEGNTTKYSTYAAMLEAAATGYNATLIVPPTKDELQGLLNKGVRELSIEGNLTAEQLVAVGTAIRAFEESKTGPNAGTVSLAMPNQTTIPASATVDRIGAFEACYALKRVSMPALSQIIGEYAFYRCQALTEITLADEAVIGNNAFTDCSKLVTVNGTLSGTIGNYAFNRCSALTVISLENVTSIGNDSFANCTALTAINLGSVTSIGDNAFYNCTGMTSLTLNSVVTSVGEDAFLNVGKKDDTYNCALTLASGQEDVSGLAPDITNKSWAGNTWKSITIASTNE